MKVGEFRMTSVALRLGCVAIFDELALALLDVLKNQLLLSLEVLGSAGIELDAEPKFTQQTKAVSHTARQVQLDRQLGKPQANVDDFDVVEGAGSGRLKRYAETDT